MNKIKKIKAFIILFISATAIMISSMCYAEGDFHVGMSLSGDGQAEEGETINLYLNISSVDAGNGIDGISANINYDSNIFEDISVEGSNGWYIGFAPSNGNVVGLRNSKVTGAGGFLIISLRVRDGVSADSSRVTVQNIIASGGIIEDGGTDDIYVSSVSRSIGIIRETYIEEDNYYEEDTEIGYVEDESYEDESYEDENEEVAQEFEERSIQQTNRSLDEIDGENIKSENENPENIDGAILENRNSVDEVPEGLKVKDTIQISKSTDLDNNASYNSNNNGSTKNIRTAITLILVILVVVFGYILIRKLRMVVL